MARERSAAIQNFCEASDLPPQRVVVLRSTGESELEVLKNELRASALDHSLPVFEAIEPALEAYAAIARWTDRWRARRVRPAASSPTDSEGRPVLTISDQKENVQ